MKIQIPKLSKILLYYSVFLSTVLLMGGLYMARSGREVVSNLLFLPLIILNLFVLVYGINLIISIIYPLLRDFDHFWDVLLLSAFWANPIVYSDSILYEHKYLLYLNPLAGIIVNMHNSIIYGTSMDFELLYWDFFYSFLILLVGIIIFKKQSNKITEIL